jgi:conjugal transfer pilus assembly protein TraB
MTWFNQLNQGIKNKQWRIAGIVVVGFLLLCGVIFLFNQKGSAPKKEEKLSITGLATHEFTEKNTESALMTQQEDVEQLKDKLAGVTKALDDMTKNQQAVLEKLNNVSSQQEVLMEEQHDMQLSTPVQEKPEKGMPQGMGAGYTPYPPSGSNMPDLNNIGKMVKITFQHHKQLQKNNDTYVPPGTYSTAVILGGADADASVNGQTHEAPLLFKLLDNGKIPGGGHSKLKNCVVIASTYGDISSERALVRLKHITCKSGENTTIDEEVEGWAWYHGKSGIKGIPYMGDGPMMKWAFIGGGIEGAGNALAYNQTTQSISALGSTATVNPGAVGQYAAYNGLSTSGKTLSGYYIKRADQYHPIIQVGAGNKVTLVFQTGFFIVPHDRQGNIEQPEQSAPTNVKIPANLVQQMNHNPPPSSLGQPVGVTS